MGNDQPDPRNISKEDLLGEAYDLHHGAHALLDVIEDTVKQAADTRKVLARLTEVFDEPQAVLLYEIFRGMAMTSALNGCCAALSTLCLIEKDKILPFLEEVQYILQHEVGGPEGPPNNPNLN